MLYIVPVAYVIMIIKDVVIEDIKIFLEDKLVQVHPDFTHGINHDNDDDLHNHCV